MSLTEKALTKLNDQLSRHMKIIGKCTAESEKYGRLLLASTPDNRYPYVYPRDSNCAVQLFRRLAGSKHGYDVADEVFELIKSIAHFLKDAQNEDGTWGQRYSLEGEDRSLYKQEDNIAHGISILCNYLLTAQRLEKLEKEVDNLEEFLQSIERALHHSIENYYSRELNLFYSTTSIHESAIEQGYTCWVNFSFLYALSLVHEVAPAMDDKEIICPEHLNFRNHFLYSVNELFMAGHRYVRRINPEGHMDFRPDFTLLSPFYYGFVHYETEIANSIKFLEKHLTDPEFDMIMRYLPFYKDFATHVHAGNGPWLQYTAILAQYHFWNGNIERGDELLGTIDKFCEEGEIPEHLSTCKRFEDFMNNEWRTGLDFEKEFHKPILLDGVDFNKILEEANNMARSYEQTGSKCMIADPSAREGGYIQFARPLMWSHVEYARALLVRAGDWWKVKG